jgi:hypothetical protein
MEGDRLGIVALYFEGNKSLALKVDVNTDELVWCKVPKKKMIDLHLVYPQVSKAYGLHLLWSWQMTNHQGYLDAIQLEFTKPDLSREFIVQFKAAASAMRLFYVQ